MLIVLASYTETFLDHQFFGFVTIVFLGHSGKYTEEAVNTKLLILQIDNPLKWKNRIDQLILNLSGACYAVSSLLHIINTITLK